MLVPWRVVDSLLGLKVSEIVLVTVSCRVVVDFFANWKGGTRDIRGIGSAVNVKREWLFTYENISPRY